MDFVKDEHFLKAERQGGTSIWSRKEGNSKSKTLQESWLKGQSLENVDRKAALFQKADRLF